MEFVFAKSMVTLQSPVKCMRILNPHPTPPHLTAIPSPLVPLSTCTSGPLLLSPPPAPLTPLHPHQAEHNPCPVPGSESNLVSWLDAANKTNAPMQLHNTAVAGELVGVDVQISNPMALGLSLTQLRAVYEHEGGATGPVNDYLKVLSSIPLTRPSRSLPSPS